MCNLELAIFTLRYDYTTTSTFLDMHSETTSIEEKHFNWGVW